MPICRWDSGETRLFFDGEPQVPFWVSQGGETDLRDAADGGVSPLLAARSMRASAGAAFAVLSLLQAVHAAMWVQRVEAPDNALAGSLVLGQDQECYGGCFSPQYQLHGDMAVLRIWDRVLRQVRNCCNPLSHRHPARIPNLETSRS